MELNKIYNQNCLNGMQRIADKSIHCCVSSSPYWGVRDYEVDGQHGLEETPALFIDQQVKVYRQVHRVLRDDGTLFLNMGDSYAPRDFAGVKRKETYGMPWMLAFALRADGWYLRQDIIWSKPNPMPESCKDRCTKSHEYIFLLTKSENYYFNQGAIAEPASENTHARISKQIPAGWDTGCSNHNGKIGRYDNTGVGRIYGEKGKIKNNASFDSAMAIMPEKRNKRSVWTITPQAFKEAHFATYPEELPYTCILAGCPEGGTVLDPYMGAGTTALVARKLQRNFIGFELNPEYVKIAERRLVKELGMFI